MTSRTPSHPLLDDLRDPSLLSLGVLHGESLDSALLKPQASSTHSTLGSVRNEHSQGSLPLNRKVWG